MYTFYVKKLINKIHKLQLKVLQKLMNCSIYILVLEGQKIAWVMVYIRKVKCFQLVCKTFCLALNSVFLPSKKNSGAFSS